MSDAEKTAELTTEEKIDYIFQTVIEIQETISELKPLVTEVQNKLPEIIQQIEPIIDGVKNSPVLKMLGVRL